MSWSGGRSPLAGGSHRIASPTLLSIAMTAPSSAGVMSERRRGFLGDTGGGTLCGGRCRVRSSPLGREAGRRKLVGLSYSATLRSRTPPNPARPAPLPTPPCSALSRPTPASCLRRATDRNGRRRRGRHWNRDRVVRHFSNPRPALNPAAVRSNADTRVSRPDRCGTPRRNAAHLRGGCPPATRCQRPPTRCHVLGPGSRPLILAPGTGSEG